jgi:hypothetical protein
MDTGSRKENASKQRTGASVLIQSEPIMLWRDQAAVVKEPHSTANLGKETEFAPEFALNL